MNAGPVLAADVGGTQMRAAMVDAHGEVLVRQARTTPADADVPAELIRPDPRGRPRPIPMERPPMPSSAYLGTSTTTQADCCGHPNPLPPGWPDLLRAESR